MTAPNSYSNIPDQDNPVLQQTVDLLDALLFESPHAKSRTYHYKSGLTERAFDLEGIEVGAVAVFHTNLEVAYEDCGHYGSSYLVGVKKAVEYDAQAVPLSDVEIVLELHRDGSHTGSIFERNLETKAKRMKSRELTLYDLGSLITDLCFARDYHQAVAGDNTRVALAMDIEE